MRESEKTWNIWTSAERAVFENGRGIDIGCGDAPIHPLCRKFDVADGDANEITKYVSEQFDYVFSSHCLEHMLDPRKTILEWWSLVKPGGRLILLVPDEDLYEQGTFPSRFNGDHKWTFTLSKRKSWSPKSINVLDLLQSLPDKAYAHAELQDCGYDYSLLRLQKDVRYARLVRSVRYRIFDKLKLSRSWKDHFSVHFHAVDQTSDGALAQIQLVAEKSPLK